MGKTNNYTPEQIPKEFKAISLKKALLEVYEIMPDAPDSDFEYVAEMLKNKPYEREIS
jgi:hypothetical protein